MNMNRNRAVFDNAVLNALFFRSLYPFGYNGYNPYMYNGSNPYMMYGTPYMTSYSSPSMSAYPSMSYSSPSMSGGYSYPSMQAYPSDYGYAQTPSTTPSTGYSTDPWTMAALNPYLPNPYVTAVANNPAPTTSVLTNKIVDIGIFDEYFEPTTYSIHVGTTIRWTNRGQERHTVTSDTGLWDSGELAPKSVNNYTFLLPGTYTYYCAFHPRQMRGVIIVEVKAMASSLSLRLGNDLLAKPQAGR